MAKKTIKKELIGAQDLYNFLFEVCNIIAEFNLQMQQNSD